MNPELLVLLEVWIKLRHLLDHTGQPIDVLAVYNKVWQRIVELCK